LHAPKLSIDISSTHISACPYDPRLRILFGRPM
jgi:hypothetical protein